MKINSILNDAIAAPTKLTAEAHLETVKVLRTKGYSWREIADFLNERGVSTDHTAVFRLTTNHKKKGSLKMTTSSLPLEADYAKALTNVEISIGQLLMLNAHYQAPNRSITYTQLAKAAGFDGHVAANSQYGKLGRTIGEAIEFEFVESDARPGEKFYSSAIGFPNPYTEGDFQLVMHHELAKAFGTLGPRWVQNKQLECLAEKFAIDCKNDERAQKMIQGLQQLGDPSDELPVDGEFVDSLATVLQCAKADLPRFVDNDEIRVFCGELERKLTDRD